MSFPLSKKQIIERKNNIFSLSSMRKKILEILEIMAEYSFCPYSSEIPKFNGIVFTLNK